MSSLDTNVIVRHLAQDNPDQQLRADAFFRELAGGAASTRLPEGVLVDSVQVLESKNLYNTPFGQASKLNGRYLRCYAENTEPRRRQVDHVTQLLDLDTLHSITGRRTPEERRRALAAIEQACRHREELLAARGGRLFPSAGRDLNRLRDQRTRELP